MTPNFLEWPATPSPRQHLPRVNSNQGPAATYTEHGSTISKPKFYASSLINREEDGGQALPPKVVQERLGHASITMTYDRYGHIFPRGDDAAQIDAAELKLVGNHA